MGSDTGSSSRTDLASALHRLRSTLARARAALELAAADGDTPPVDDERLGKLTARGLRRLGYEADSAGHMRQLRPGEVVVFDLGLLASLDAAQRAVLRAARPIVVTGAADPQSRAIAESIGAVDYLVKPVELEGLAAAINRRMAEASK